MAELDVWVLHYEKFECVLRWVAEKIDTHLDIFFGRVVALVVAPGPWVFGVRQKFFWVWGSRVFTKISALVITEGVGMSGLCEVISEVNHFVSWGPIVFK